MSSASAGTYEVAIYNRPRNPHPSDYSLQLVARLEQKGLALTSYDSPHAALLAVDRKQQWTALLFDDDFHRKLHKRLADYKYKVYDREYGWWHSLK